MQTTSTMSIYRRYKNVFKHHISRNKFYALLVLLGIILLLKFRSSAKLTYTGSKYNVYTTIFGEHPLPEPTQKDIEYFAKYVQLNYSVDDNFASGKKMYEGGFYLATISLFNTGNNVIPESKWQLYGYFMRLAEPDSYPYPQGFFIHACGLRLYQVEGSLYKFEPVGGMFHGLNPNERLTCKIKLGAFQVARTDSMPRWYVTGNELAPKIIENTDDETLSFVKDFTLERQYKKRIDDNAVPYSPEERYNLYSSDRQETVSPLNVIPTPLSVTVNDKLQMQFNTRHWVIVKSEIFEEEVNNFADGMEMHVVSSKPNRRYIQITKSPVIIAKDQTPVQHPEAYTIEADPTQERIIIAANTNKGAFYALHTLSSIMFATDAKTNTGISLVVNGFKVTDMPRYNYRGLHLDVARNFIEVEEILKIIDILAMYKMNKLHLHLSDDEGWRLEIPGIPELTQIGGSRCHDLKEEQCILPMLGSGPYSNTSGSGFYTVDEYKEILGYADEHHIDVIPEFDMPGHSRAAIRSLHSTSRVRKDTYSVIDQNDNSDFRSGQFFSRNSLNPCMSSTYVFVKKILQEVKKMHADTQPLNFYHFGGDEVADGAWSDSPICQKFMEERKDMKSQYDLMKFFVKNLTDTAASEGMSVGAWEDAMLSHDVDDVGIPFTRDAFQNKDIYVYVWKRPVERNTPHRAKLFANKGYKVILAYGSYLYFDHPYEPDPEERGLYWATRKLSTKDAWSFNQNIMFNDKDVDCPPSIKGKDMCYKLLKPENVMGMQAELWTETVRTNEQVEYMLFPRLLAVAERAWHKASWEDMSDIAAKKTKAADWSIFVNKVGYHELPRLDKADVHYRLAPPGAKISNNKVRFKTEFPGLEIEYLSSETGNWELVSHDMPINGKMKIRSRSSDGKRFSRTIEIG